MPTTDDDETLDANDAARWAVTGLSLAAVTIAVLSVRDALGWTWWEGAALAVPAGVGYGVLRGLVARQWRRRRSRSVPTCDTGPAAGDETQV